VVCVVLPLAFHRLIKGTWLGFLYERPAMFRLGGRKVKALTAVAV
jgi:hypothetical protein